MEKVAIILVNFNDEQYISTCLKCIYNQSYRNFQVYIVDNASTDGSIDKVEKNYKNVKWVMSPQNVGWGEGCNLGITAAIEDGADYSLLLNTDTEIENSMLEILMNYADAQTVVAPRMYRNLEDGRQVLWYAGGEVDFVSGDINQCLYTMEQGQCENFYEVNFITGCCMLINTKIIQRVGMLDSSYFMYFEDVDFCIRLKENGIKMLYIPKAGLWHKVGGSAGGEVSYISQYYTVRNRLYFSEKYKHYMQVDTMDVLRRIMAGYAYFESPDAKKYRQFVIRGIYDFLQKKMGKENNLIQDNAYFLEGFHTREEDNYNSWYWAGEKKVKIEIINSANYLKYMQIRCILAPPPGKKHRKVKLFVDEKYICETDTPGEVCIKVKMESNEHKNLLLKTREKLVEGKDGDPRKFAFQIMNFVMKETDEE